MRKPMPCPINRKQYLIALKQLAKAQKALDKATGLFKPQPKSPPPVKADKPVKAAKAKRGRKAKKA